MKNFFISYNKADRAWAEWIAWVLEEADYKVVIQAWDFRPGSNFVLEMHQALKDAERVLAVLSPDFIASHFTAPEWAAAFARDPTGKDRKLVPVRVREADLSGLLGQINYIDFVGVHDESATRKLLLDGVKLGRGKPNGKPAFPGAPERAIKIQPRFPGSLPPIWNVPHNRNRNFTGRDDLLSTLRSQLLAGHHSALTALHGLGGIGKTQTAVEYAYRYAGEYELVWWLRSEDPTTLAGDYALLASKLELLEAAADQQSAARAVKDRLSASRGWLLVFDNARVPQEIRPYLPVGSGGHVIITSRSPDWRSVADPLSVATMSPEGAINLLHGRSGRRDERASPELVEELGYLPLAIEQAAAYIDEHGRSISEYLDLYRKHRRKILDRGQASPDYPATVGTTWELSFAEVQSRSPAGAELLRLCAFLAPDDIPSSVIRNGEEYLPESLAGAAGDELDFDDAIFALRRHSLIERTGDALSVHRLVQAVVRDRMETSERQQWAGSAAWVVREAFPYDSDEVSTWPVCARLLPHATVVAAHCEAQETAREAAAYLLVQSATYLDGRANYSTAIAFGERALRLYEAENGPEHPNVALALSNLSRNLIEAGDLERARTLLERALGIAERVSDPGHASLAGVVNNLGGVLRSLGELTEARTHYERVLRMDEAVDGPRSAAVGMSLNNIGCVLMDLGDQLEARRLFEQALEISEEAHGPDHPQVALTLINLGSVLQNLGDLAGARSLYERALEIHEACYGSDHPMVARAVNSLGRLHRALGEVEQARRQFERALEILEAKLGPRHPSTERARDNLASLDRAQA